LILDFQPPDLWEKKFLLFCNPVVIFMAALAD
jgi:hypothetical protein